VAALGGFFAVLSKVRFVLNFRAPQTPQSIYCGGLKSVYPTDLVVNRKGSFAGGRADEEIEVDGRIFRPERLPRRERHDAPLTVDAG
jgi:hypothetical protein